MAQFTQIKYGHMINLLDFVPEILSLRQTFLGNFVAKKISANVFSC